MEYQFVAALAAGGRVRLFYLRAGVYPGSHYQKQQLPYAVVSLAEWTQMQEDAPSGLYKSKFRIVREYGRHLDLEWTT